MSNSSFESQLPLADIIAIGAVLGTISSDEKWSGLEQEDAAFVRAALVKADQLRAQEIDPGDAYLQCIADMKRYRLMIEVAALVTKNVQELPETTQLPDAS